MAGILTRFESTIFLCEGPVQILEEEVVQTHIRNWNALSPVQKNDQELFLLDKKVRSRSLSHVADSRATLSRLLDAENLLAVPGSPRRAEILYLLGIVEMRFKRWDDSLGYLNQIEGIAGQAAELQNYVQAGRFQGPGFGMYVLAGGVGASVGLLSLVNLAAARPQWVREASKGFREASLAWELRGLLEHQIHEGGIIGCARSVFAALVVLSAFRGYFNTRN